MTSYASIALSHTSCYSCHIVHNYLGPSFTTRLSIHNLCRSCHYAAGPVPESWPDSEPHRESNDGCRGCHDGISGPELPPTVPGLDHQSDDVDEDGVDDLCIDCHYESGTTSNNPPMPRDDDHPTCTTCHNPHGTGVSHTTHTSSARELNMDCGDCHGPNFDTVCNACHSPDGTYDGVNDENFGARANWAEGVYNESGALKAGKEKWCAGCHDTGTSTVNGVAAPPVAGDGATWDFYANGHGRNAVVSCTSCHDTTATHTDGLARTYSFDNADYAPTQSGVAYAAGYRLKDVGGEVPLMIPANYNITFEYDAGLMRDTAFRLCFSCHAASAILDDTPGDGIDSNFKASLPDPPRNYSYAWGSGADTNEHVSHIMNYVGPFADSDWDAATNGAGGMDGRDTMTSCSSCHNVHGAAGAEGSTNEAMVRDGSLVGRTGYGFSYVIEDAASDGYPWVTSTGATQSTSTGAIFRNNTANMCGGSMCHDSPEPPPASSYDATGSSWGTYIEYYRPYGDY